MLLQRRIRMHRPKTEPGRLDPYYGYGYNPHWPSILSIAHDETDGGVLFVITDRPCILASPDLPLEVAGLSILDAMTILPVKFRLAMSGAVPLGAVWRWDAQSGNLYDPITGHGLNLAMGTCADFPGPYTPPPPAMVISAGASGSSCSLQFDRPVIYNGGPLDDAITFDGFAPLGISDLGSNTLGFTLGNPVYSGSTWNINRQPDWITTQLVVPENGVFP